MWINYSSNVYFENFTIVVDRKKETMGRSDRMGLKKKRDT